MPDESDYKNYKSIEDYGKTLEGSKYFHSLYLRAVNHPIRKVILEIISEFKNIPYERIVEILLNRGIIKDEKTLQYNIDYLIKALCVEVKEINSKKVYTITQVGKVIDYLEK